MYRKVLVPLDGSPQAASALPLARALVANAEEAALALVRVVDDATSLPAESSDEAHGSRAYLSWVAGELHGGTTRVETRTSFGSPAAEIVKAVAELGADLIAMATYTHDPAELLFGSVSEQVVAQSPVPVVVFRPGGRRVTHVRSLLVPLDGSVASRRALAPATELALQHAARIQLLTVVAGMPGYLKKPLPGVDFGPSVRPAWEAARLEAESALQHTVDLLRDQGIEVTARAVIGDAGRRIAAVAEEIDTDLIVMSTRAGVGPVRVLLGSVAASVVRHARRPVLLVRRPDRW